MAEIGDLHNYFLECFLNTQQLAIQFLDPVTNLTHFSDQRVGIFAGFFEFGDLG